MVSRIASGAWVWRGASAGSANAMATLQARRRIGRRSLGMGASYRRDRGAWRGPGDLPGAPDRALAHGSGPARSARGERVELAVGRDEDPALGDHRRDEPAGRRHRVAGAAILAVHPLIRSEE